MKIKDRMAVAQRAAEIARASGANVEILPRGVLGDATYTTATITWPELSAMFDIGGCLKPGVLIHFYGAKRDLRHARVFDSVSTVHKRKATTWCDTAARFADYWPIICAAVQSGEVFAA